MTCATCSSARREGNAWCDHRRGAEDGTAASARKAGRLCRACLARQPRFSCSKRPRSAAARRSGFELMPRIGIEFTTKHIPGVRDPLASIHPWYALVDISTSDFGRDGRNDDAGAAGGGLRGRARFGCGHRCLARPAGCLLASAREHVGCPETRGGSIKHDVSVPVSRIPAFLEEADAAVHALMPDARICAFGHLGDGNIHYNISQPVGADRRRSSPAGARSTPSFMRSFTSRRARFQRTSRGRWRARGS